MIDAVENRLPDIKDVELFGPLGDAIPVDQGTADIQHPRDIPQVLVGTTFPIITKFSQNDVFRMGGVGVAIFE